MLTVITAVSPHVPQKQKIISLSRLHLPWACNVCRATGVWCSLWGTVLSSPLEVEPTAQAPPRKHLTNYTISYIGTTYTCILFQVDGHTFSSIGCFIDEKRGRVFDVRTIQPEMTPEVSSYNTCFNAAVICLSIIADGPFVDRFFSPLLLVWSTSQPLIAPDLPEMRRRRGVSLNERGIVSPDERR